MSDADTWGLPPRFRPVGEIARGAEGVVLRVRDTVTGRPLALKVLLHRRARPDQARRFLAEARITSGLRHPGVPAVLGFGSLADGRPFFGMELIEGRTLAGLLRQRPAPLADLPCFLHLFGQIAQTVAYAHARGVIHRDLKPLNVMVTALGKAQVTDWGIAKRLPEAATGYPGSIQSSGEAAHAPTADTADQLTQVGQILGTFAYMPPEQARGEPGRLDERCDVFGLGAILCQILTGRPPYVSSGRRSLQDQARDADLADAFARLDGCGVDAEVVALAKGCLAPDPRDRPRHAGGVADAVVAYLEPLLQAVGGGEGHG